MITRGLLDLASNVYSTFDESLPRSFAFKLDERLVFLSSLLSCCFATVPSVGSAQRAFSSGSGEP